jgi:hypothetical protein
MEPTCTNLSLPRFASKRQRFEHCFYISDGVRFQLDFLLQSSNDVFLKRPAQMLQMQTLACSETSR